MDCESEKDRENSKKIFMKAKTVKKFMKQWGKFYRNKICIPTYLDKFVGEITSGDQSNHDNPQANFELGEKLYKISKIGILAVDSQVTIPGNQKGYITAFVHKNLAERLAQECNRYPDIVAFYNTLYDKGSEGLYVTYDSLIVKENKMVGTPYSQVGRVDTDSLDQIREWMSEPVKRVINKNNYVYFVMINPSFTSPPEYVFDVLLNVLTS